MKKKLLITLSIICIMISGCSARKMDAGYSLGVIMTNGYEEHSAIILLNDELKEHSTIPCAVANITTGEGAMSGSMVYLAANGDSDHLDYGAVLSLDTADLALEKYELGRTNITDFRIDPPWIYTNSNLNWVFCLDRVNTATREIQSVEMTDLLIYCFVPYHDEICVLAEETGTTAMALYKYSFLTGKREKLCQLMDHGAEGYTDISYMNGSVYALVDDTLFQFSLRDGILKTHNMEDAPACKLCAVSGDLYIIISDPAAGSDISLVKKFIGEERRTETVGTYRGTILQIEFSESGIYIMDYDGLHKTHIKSGEFVTDLEYVFGTKYDYCGGFFVK